MLATAKVQQSEVEWTMSGDYMTRLRWRHWGTRRTNAVGIDNLNLCNPCAAGRVRHMRGCLSTMHSCRGVRLYTVATAAYFLHGRWCVADRLGQPSDPAHRSAESRSWDNPQDWPSRLDCPCPTRLPILPGLSPVRKVTRDIPLFIAPLDRPAHNRMVVGLTKSFHDS